MRDRRRFLTVLSGGIPPTNPAYIAKALSYSPIGFWPMVSDFVNQGSAGGTATGTGVTFQDGQGKDLRAAAYFDNTRWVDVYSAALAGAWNGDEFCMGGWFRQTQAALDDAAYHDMPIMYSVTANNYAWFRSISGSIGAARYGTGAGGVLRSWDSLASGFGTGWRHIMMRCTIAGTSLQMYHGGVATGTNVTSNGTWEGAMSSTGMLFGASSGSHTLHRWYGWMQYVGIWPVLSAPQILDLATMV